ncbi:mitochondrial glycoprotein [Chytriomyces sp. MP71]|nr:mitochondrial glycoprotein [Chytriomyces sp. MP71]
MAPAACRASLLPLARSAPAPVWSRAFSAAPLARSHGQGDRDLAHKLESELKFEKENQDAAVPAFIKEFNNKGIFKVNHCFPLLSGFLKGYEEMSIEDKVGEKEVTLVRNFGNEKISVIFSTDALAEKAEFDEGESDVEETFSVNVTVLIEKKVGTTDHGALELNATIQENAFFIDSVSFNPSSSLMSDQSAEGDWQRRGRYGGPVFQDLDEALQDQFHDFLRERGFDEALAEFVPQYIDFKEQGEYVEWLKRVGEWVAK